MQDKTTPSIAATGSRAAPDAASHAGVQVLGEQGSEGRKAFYIHIEALPGKEQQVMQMLQDIRDCVEHEPATGPWFALRLAPTTFGIFEAFPDLAGRQAHVEGGGGDIFRDLARMNAILAFPAQVHRADVLLSKDRFSHLLS
ncbi:putative quinol monooxygenase [Halopseudomonas sp.]|uniref:putative quinol monooxygenase n=1 Tax=Halopseudomonas sp. TaxID=2901191 RepID=UPI0030015242